MTITTHNLDKLLTLPPPGWERQRAELLARSFRARWVPALEGYIMPPAVAARFEALYDCGYTCAYRRGAWWYGFDSKTLTLDRYQAVKAAKEVVCPK